MLDWLHQGGLLFMLPLTGLGLGVVGATLWGVLRGVRSEAGGATARRTVFHLGLFAVVLGFFSHAISLYQMMQAIESVGSVSPAMVAGGLRVSLVAPVYGLGIGCLALACWFGLGLVAHPASQSAAA